MSLACPLPARAGPRGFEKALDREATRDLLEARICVGARILDLEPDYLRFKGGDGALVGWRVEIERSGGGAIGGYVTLRAADSRRLRDEAAKLAWKKGEIRDGLRAFALCEEEGLLVLSYPLDRAIPDLRRLSRVSRFRDLVKENVPSILPEGFRISKRRSRSLLVRYKPERRAVLRWSLGLVGPAGEERSLGLYLRLHARPDARTACRVLRACRAAALPAPRLLHAERDRLVLESECEGRPLDPAEPKDLEAAAGILERFHRIPPPKELPDRSPASLLAQAASLREDYAVLDPSLGESAGRLFAVLQARLPAQRPPVLVHGDFHSGQVLLSGGVTALLDFDRSGLGDPEWDAAVFEAHLRASGAEHPVPDLCASRDPERLRWHRAFALLRVAILPFRSLSSEWPARVRALLEEGLRLYDSEAR